MSPSATLRVATERYRQHNDSIAKAHGETAADRAAKHVREARVLLSRVARVNVTPGIHELTAAVQSLASAVETAIS